MSKLRGAVIGVGYLGKFHAQKYAALKEDVQLVAVVDKSLDNGKSLAANLGCDYYSDVSQVLGKIDVATVATPTTLHYGIVKELLQNGVHVLVEKPIAATAHEGEELVLLAKKNKLKLQVGHIERFNPAFMALEKVVKSPRTIQALRLAPFKARALDVDVATDLMIHDIELVMKLMGEAPRVVDVQGQSLLTKTWDYVHAGFSFSGGRTAAITVSRCHPTAVRSLFVVDSEAAWLADLGTGELQKVTRSTRDPLSTETTLVEKTQVEKHDAMLMETKSFFESVLQSKDPAISGEQGLKAMEVLETVLGRLG